MLKRTPFYDIHVRSGAKIVDFGGWEMPVQYSGILSEHEAVRARAGLFDVSHMGEITAKGPNAYRFVQNLITNNLAKCSDGQVLYSPMCYPDGGIVDDLLVYKKSDEDFYIVVNASNVDKDFAWMLQNSCGAALKNISSNVAELAVQGPNAVDILSGLADYPLSSMKAYWFDEFEFLGIPMLVSRTGYTGEDGFELYFDPKHAGTVWDRIMQAGKDYDLIPCGLGARDSLRMEAGLMLYGNDMDKDTTPLEAPLKWTVDLNKDFIGSAALLEKPRKKAMTGFKLAERAVPRHGNKVFSADGKEGYVSSGGFSPVLQEPVGFAYLPLHSDASEFEVEVRQGKLVSAHPCSYRFYKRKKP